MTDNASLDTRIRAVLAQHGRLAQDAGALADSVAAIRGALSQLIPA